MLAEDCDNIYLKIKIKLKNAFCIERFDLDQIVAAIRSQLTCFWDEIRWFFSFKMAHAETHSAEILYAFLHGPKANYKK